MYWLQFILSSLVIVVAGIHLTNYADRLSAQLNLGKAVVGVVLLGFITSLPEAITCIVSVRSLNADDLAVGNLLGSNNFNPMLIVLMDLVYRKESITNTIISRKSTLYSAAIAMIMSGVIIAELLIDANIHVGPISLGGVIILALYVFGMKKVAAFSAEELKAMPELAETEEKVEGSLANTWIHIFIGAVVVVIAAMLLARSADTLAEATGLGRTFVGSIFLAIVTSLPEMVVTLSALKMGSMDLAVGNIFGSNMTNTLIILVCSLFNPQGPILYEVSQSHILTAAISMMLVAIAVKGIKSKQKNVYFGMAWDSWLMLSVFLSGTAILYVIR